MKVLGLKATLFCIGKADGGVLGLKKKAQPPFLHREFMRVGVGATSGKLLGYYR